MSQIDGHATGGHTASGRFANGNSEYRAKRLRIAALAEELASHYDARSVAAKQLVYVAAGHLDEASRGRSHVLRARASRMAAKILALLPRPPAPPPPTLEELLNGQR